MSGTVLNHNDDCARPDWIHLTTAAFGRAAATQEYFENLIACDPLADSNWGHWMSAAMWSDQVDRIIEAAGSYNDSGQRQSTYDYVMALIAAGRTDEARAVTETEIRDAGSAALLQFWAAVRQGDANGALAIAPSQPNWRGEIIIVAARLGDRDAANEEAALIDSRPFGYIALLQRIYFCYCGAPFDLKSTPTLARMLEESGLPWPPESVVDWPLKDW